MISLIPKVDNPEMASQFRPLSYYNTLYKCISKLLCSRLAYVLPDIVNPAQAAFVKERSLIQNVLVYHDFLRHYKRKTSPRCLMKINLTKSYDMVQWDFMQEILEGYKFPTNFIQLIMEYLSTTSFSIKINGRDVVFVRKGGLTTRGP